MSAFLPDSDSEDELPPAWEERTTSDGSVFYVNHVTQGTQWNHPRTGKKKIVSGELPPGWEKRVDDSGGVQYVDVARKRITYTDPRLAFAKELSETDMTYRQRFDGSSTALQVLLGCDLSGKTFLVTGATNGIGFETARSLALHGAHVIISGRSEATCRNADNQILQERPHAKTSILPMELSSLNSVRLASQQLRSQFQHLDVVILNAGVFSVGWQLTEDNLNLLFQVNYLSQFYFMLLIEPMLRQGSRVVIVSSESHRMSSLSRKNLNQEILSPSTPSGYWDMMAYNNSKLCNVLHAVELSHRLANRGVCVVSLHPGTMMSTSLPRKSCLYRLLFALVRPFTKSMQQGAATSVYCAVAPEVENFSGLYFNNCCLTNMSENAKKKEFSSQLWDVSLQILKEKNVYPPSD